MTTHQEGHPIAFCPLLDLGSPTGLPIGNAWSDAPLLHLLDNCKSTQPNNPGSVRIARTKTSFRALFELVTPDPRATLTGYKQPLYQEDVAELFIDPFGDASIYYEFEVNPLNARLDLVIRRTRYGARKDFRWESPGFTSAAMRTTHGWNAEFEIPFRDLPTSPEDCPSWRVNFTRIDRPSNAPRELTAWSPTGIAQFHVPSKFGEIRFT
jgi:hypothetical protein